LTTDGSRLAFFRRVGTALLVVTGAPVLALSRSVNATLESIRAICAASWLALLLPMTGVLYVEWRHRQYLKSLRAAAADRRGCAAVQEGPAAPVPPCDLR
jgi:hypothetical protein